MKRILWLGFLLLLTACQPQNPATITILDGEQIHTLVTGERVPVNLLAEARVTLAPSDLLLINGHPFPPQQSLPPEIDTLQTRRAVSVTLAMPGGQELVTAAGTVSSG